MNRIRGYISAISKEEPRACEQRKTEAPRLRSNSRLFNFKGSSMIDATSADMVNETGPSYSTTNTKIKEGYYIRARREKYSYIAKAPPHVREIWNYLLREANHEPSKDGSIKRGQCLRTYDDIREGLAWFIGWRKMKYSKWDCEKAMKVLLKATMIATEKTTRGLIITICNYDYYQNPENYDFSQESHRKATRKPQTTDTINNNDKNERSYIYPPEFEELWKDYPRRNGEKAGKKDAFKAFSGIKSEDRSLLKKSLANYKRSKRVRDGFVQDAARFLRNWSDWVEFEPEEKLVGPIGWNPVRAHEN